MSTKSSLRIVLERLSARAADAENEAVPLDGVTPTHAAVLAAIVQVGRREGVSGIARLLEMTQSATTWNVQRLERMGLVHRIQRVGSKVHSILLTQEGAAVLARLDSAEGYVHESALCALSGQERETLLQLLDKAARAAC